MGGYSSNGPQKVGESFKKKCHDRNRRNMFQEISENSNISREGDYGK